MLARDFCQAFNVSTDGNTAIAGKPVSHGVSARLQLPSGMSNKEIGEARLLSSKTISTCKTRLIEKLNVKSVVYLADFAKRNFRSADKWSGIFGKVLHKAP